ncbi:MAG TPA: DUF47 family protein [Campylobacterales bacterium]|nr:DUF47 family protein [Campylobacterales bacterium]
MSIKSLFKKYILPHEINFVAMLQEQSLATNQMVKDLYGCFIDENKNCCASISDNLQKTQALKNRNMEQLLHAFITPIDRESIYRAVTQLDWMVISVKHFMAETKAYQVDTLPQYKDIFDLILQASSILNKGFQALEKNRHTKVSKKAEQVRELSDAISQKYIEEMVILSENPDCKTLFIHKEILAQLKEIGRRLHITANTLQDIVVKMD